MMKTLKINSLKSLENVVVLPHTMPDGDTIGSCIGLALGLAQFGAKTYIVSDDPLPRSIAFLDRGRLITTEAFNALNIDYSTCITVDMSNDERLADRHFLIEGKHVINIDHHKSNTSFGDEQYIELRAASGEIIFDILNQMGTEITSDIAEALYVAINTDTGGFKYGSTTPETLRIAADLMEVGFDIENVMFNLYHNESLSRVKLHAKIIAQSTYYQGGKIALALVPKAFRDELGASYEDADGIVESIRDIEGVQMVVLIKERDNGELKISMRSLGNIDVSQIAVKHHGGGHKNAAGFSMTTSLDEAIEHFERDVFAKLAIE